MTDRRTEHIELSPLEEIERLTLEVAKERNLSPGMADAEGELRSIVVELVEQWRDDFRRGIRQLDLTEPTAVVDRAMILQVHPRIQGGPARTARGALGEMAFKQKAFGCQFIKIGSLDCRVIQCRQAFSTPLVGCDEK